MRSSKGDAEGVRSQFSKEATAMGHDGSPEPKATAPDPHVVSDDYVQYTSEIGSVVRQAALAKRARAANHRRGEFRWFEFQARRRFRTTDP